MKIIAKTITGQEYMYSVRSARRVNPAKCEQVLKILNTCRWGLKEGETWYAYDVDRYDTAYIVASQQQFVIHKDGRLTARG